ncbi:hydrolase [Pseudovibrio japonicus]|uniref:Hydrolase n=1 Tax=Pseudovibrio japonicus TaxID=366534 RepID=A0ABQ3EMJ0_9HYPH|nr:hydrolase [Pseudovibrio japonicus]
MDSEPIFLRVVHDMLLSFGGTLSFQECWDKFIGKTTRAVDAYMTEQGITAPENWADEFHKQARSRLEKEVLPIPGARQVVEQLAEANVPLCVASNGHPVTVRATLKRTGLLPWFEGNIFSAHEVGASKPAPDVFLHAAKLAGVHPEHCVVIEDSPSGLRAAANAGMPCFAYTPNTTPTPPDLFGAHPFQTMDKLPDLLGLVPA